MATAFLTGLLALLAFVLLLLLVERADPAKLARALVWLGIAAVVLVAGLLLISGRFLQSLPALLAALAILWQRAALQRLTRRGLAGMGAGRRRTSRVETAALEMTLDLATGALDGTVRRGRFAGRRLAELDEEECLALHRDLAGDEESRRLLEAYLDRRMPGWRARAGGEGEETAGESPPGHGGMTREQALRILGLAEGAGREEIIAAHRRLMQKLHPDHGGSDFLAAQINEAKRVLLEEE
ncbi:MAG: molecular chaperone DnaJ [Rhodothalassiaceae bacterium]|nr:MAG: molecular chaperone DnaJ [Rhodothalassiaceae bacterium]